MTAASVTSVTVTWAAPSNAGPPITSYDLQYRIMGTSGAFTVGPQDVSGLSEPIPGLEENTAYEVQVLATNAEGDSDWSEAGSGATDANAAPAVHLARDVHRGGEPDSKRGRSRRRTATAATA